MNCSTVRTRLTALLDAELSARVAAQVQAHLESCPDCTRVMEEERILRAQADTWSVETGDVWDEVKEEIRAESDREALTEILTEMRRLQGEVRALRGEVVSLRSQLSSQRQEGPSSPSPMLPYAPTNHSTSVLV